MCSSPEEESGDIVLFVNVIFAPILTEWTEMMMSKVRNISHVVSEFILLGFPCRWEIEIFLFSIFFITYILTLLGNMAIMCAVR